MYIEFLLSLEHDIGDTDPDDVADDIFQRLDMFIMDPDTAIRKLKVEDLPSFLPKVQDFLFCNGITSTLEILPPDDETDNDTHEIGVSITNLVAVDEVLATEAYKRMQAH